MSDTINYLAILFEPPSFRIGKLSEKITNMSSIYLIEGRAFKRMSVLGDWSWLDYFENNEKAVGLHVSIMSKPDLPDYLGKLKNVNLNAKKNRLDVWFTDDHVGELIGIQTMTHEYYSDDTGIMMALFDTEWYVNLLQLDGLPTFEIQRPSLKIENVESW